MGYFCCGHSGGPKLMFHWLVAWLCWPPLWWGVISFKNFRRLKLGLYFCVDFLACITDERRQGFPCFKWINRVCWFDRFLWNLGKMFLGYQCAKVCEAFSIFQILLLLHALMWPRLANVQFANFKIDFLDNQLEYRKASHTFVVYHLIDTVQFVWSYVPAGRQVIQFSK